MNVGLIYNSNSPTQGGGFTFQEELLKHIELIKDKNISFILICNNKRVPAFVENQKRFFKKIVILNRNLIDKFNENLIRNFHIVSERSNYQSKLDKICLEHKIDLVIFLDDIHTIYTRLPFVTIVYDIDHLKYPFFPEYSKNFNWYKKENSLGSHLRRASGIICGTNYGISQIQQYYGVPKNKFFKIPHPAINLEKNDLDDNKYIEILGLEKNKFIFYPAQFWAHKNHKSLINLAIEFKKNFKDDMKIVLSGSDKGNLKYIIDEIKKNNLENIIKYLGFINQNQLYSLYKNCLALTYVSYGGPENLPPLEAFSLGCPVIAAKNDGSIEQLEDGAILIDPNDVDEFIQSIDKLKNTEFKLNLIQKGYSVAEKKSIKYFMKDLHNLLFKFKKYIEAWKSIN